MNPESRSSDQIIDGPRPVYYFLRDHKKKPAVTVCLLRYKDAFSRGISICAEKDQINKSFGNELAYARALIGVRILVNAEKPLSEKQIRRNKQNKKFINIQAIKRPDAKEVFISKAFDNLLPPYKIVTTDTNGLNEFEKRVLTKTGVIDDKISNS